MKRGAPDPPMPERDALFQFTLTRMGLPQRWRNVLQRERFSATLTQSRDAGANDNVGEEITDALRGALLNQLTTQQDVLPHHTVHFTMQLDHFTHAFQSTTFTVQEVQDQSPRLRTYLQSLAEKLNSNEDFKVDDTFTMEMTLIRNPGRGGRGKRDRARRLGTQSLQSMLKTKRSIVQIQNNDDLCCARAIVTMKALADTDAQHPDYKNLRKGRPIQEKRAKELHRLADVPEGPCGIQELNKFQTALPGYQLKVLSVDKPFTIIFAGPPAPKLILLVKVNDHYHGCTSFGGFLDWSYYCHDCDKGFDVDDITHHPCLGVWCQSCKRKKCVDHQKTKQDLPRGEKPKPTQVCSSCDRSFFGNDCYASHLQDSQHLRSLCATYRKCLSCRCQYEAAPSKKKERISNKYRHRCGYGECPFCETEVDQATHKCFIQPIDEEEDEPKFMKVPAAEVGERQVLARDEDGWCWVAMNTPLFIYADYEAIVDDDGNQSPILLCCESAEEDEINIY